MDAAIVKNTLIAIISQIQTDSGLDCPTLSGTTQPVGNIPKFDSKIWLVATSILAKEIKAEIPDDENIFVNETTKTARSIDEIASYVCAVIEKNKKKNEAVKA